MPSVPLGHLIGITLEGKNLPSTEQILSYMGSKLPPNEDRDVFGLSPKKSASFPLEQNKYHINTINHPLSNKHSLPIFSEIIYSEFPKVHSCRYIPQILYLVHVYGHMLNLS